MKFLYAALVCALSVANVSGASAKEEAQAFSADYFVSFLGFTVAKSSFTSRIAGSRFELRGTVASAGLAQIFDSTRGTTLSSGHFAKDATRTDDYSVTYIYGKKSKRTVIDFTGGNVVNTSNVPPLPKRGGNWVAVKPADLNGVTDPISATLVRASSAASVCGRTLRFFDGEIRADVALSKADTVPASSTGYEGEAVTCKARLIPVSGYDRRNASLNFVKNNSRILITFAQLGETGVYAPIHATIGTQIGTVTIRARGLDKPK